MLLRFKKLPAMLACFVFFACMSKSAFAPFMQQVVDVPTLDEYGLIITVGLLVAAGGIELARRKKKK